MIKVEVKNDALVLRHTADKLPYIVEHLFISDVHFDSKYCDRKLLTRILDEAKTKGAKVFIFGDWFDAMGGKWDKRSDKSSILPEYQGADYFDRVITDTVEFLKPYGENIELISEGNHETSVLRRQEFDMLSAVKYKLFHETGHDFVKGAYDGWIKFMFENKNSGRRQSKTAFYHHGSGGGAIMSHGTLKTRRRQSMEQADIYISGHIHTTFSVPLGLRRLNEQCIEVTDEIQHLQLGGFKAGHKGKWERSKELPATVLGGYWLRFTYSSNGVSLLEIRAK